MIKEKDHKELIIGKKISTYGIWKGEKRGKYDIRNKVNNLTGKEWIKSTASVWEYDSNHIYESAKNIIRMFSKNDKHEILTFNDNDNTFNNLLINEAYKDVDEENINIDVKKYTEKTLLNDNKYQLTISFINKSLIKNGSNNYEKELKDYKNWINNEGMNIANSLFRITLEKRYSIVILNEFNIDGRKINVSNNIIECYLNAGFEYRGKITSFDKESFTTYKDSNEKNDNHITDIHTYILVFYKSPKCSDKIYHNLYIPNKVFDRHKESKKLDLPSILYSNTKVDDIGKQHPATYSYLDIKYLIEKFIGLNKNKKIFDPFLGVSSTILAAQFTGNIGLGIELNRKYLNMSINRLANFGISNIKTVFTKEVLKENYNDKDHILIQGDSLKRINNKDIPEFDYCVTSPPYHNILRNEGKGVRSDNSQFRQGVEYYSESKNDLGNQETFIGYLTLFSKVMDSTYNKLKNNGFCSIVISDFTVNKKEMDVSGEIIRLMEEIGYIYIGVINLVQSQKAIYPFGYPYKFVINHVNQFVLNFRKAEELG